MTVSERIFKIIDEENMTQKEISEKTGIPQSTISDWRKKNTNPASDKILIICEVLKVTATILPSESTTNAHTVVSCSIEPSSPSSTSELENDDTEPMPALYVTGAGSVFVSVESSAGAFEQPLKTNKTATNTSKNFFILIFLRIK